MLRYKMNVIQELSEKGYSIYRLRKDKLIGMQTVENLKQGKPIAWSGIDTLCRLLQCQPADLIEYVADDTDKEKRAESADTVTLSDSQIERLAKELSK